MSYALKLRPRKKNETALKADNFLVMAHGTAEEMARAKTILGTANASRVDMHAGAKMVAAAH